MQGLSVENLTQALFEFKAESVMYTSLTTLNKVVLVSTGHMDTLIPAWNAKLRWRNIQSAHFREFSNPEHSYFFQFPAV
jgi:hypothetical protein